MEGEPVRQIGLDSAGRDTESDGVALEALLGKVYQASGHDFREYKRSTVKRRLQRRLYATGVRTYLEYMHFLDSHYEEYQRLADDLTIKVSGFFRSPYTFQQVASLVLPELVFDKENRGQRSLRIWSSACARGEEPYSIAILLDGFLGHRIRDFDISIYASDISMAALKEAQAGVYSLKEIGSLPPAILDYYFTRQGDGYAVNSAIRQMVSFSYFDLTSTVRLSSVNFDCIFCCNVLIQYSPYQLVLG